MIKRAGTIPALYGCDPEKWIPVFGKDHAQTINESAITIRRKVITL
jgi:hypothetical protein